MPTPGKTAKQKQDSSETKIKNIGITLDSPDDSADLASPDDDADNNG